MAPRNPEILGMNGRATDYRILGVRVSALTKQDWLRVVDGGVRTRQRRLLVSQNLHSAFLVPRSQTLKRLQARADVVRIDGMPLVWVAKLIGLPVSKAHRAGFMDLMPLLMATAAERGWRILVIGGKPGVAERAAERLRAAHPGLQLLVEDGYFPMDDSDGGASRRLQRVTDEEADIVLIGMGMPRQEEFLDLYLDRVTAPVVGTCGAAFDYVAGVIPMAPRWLSTAGLEWLFRLLAEPRRLWRRYLVEPLHLVPRLVTDLRERNLGAEHFVVQSESDGDGPK